MDYLDTSEKFVKLCLIGAGVLCVSLVTILSVREHAKANKVITVSSYNGLPLYEEFEPMRVDGRDDLDWEFYSAFEEEFSSITVSEALTSSASFTQEYSLSTNFKTTLRTYADEQLIMLSDMDAWLLVSNGMYSSYPQDAFRNHRTELNKLRSTYAVTLKVKCWFWANPNDPTDMSKTTVYRSFTVNKGIAQLFEKVFEEIYNDPSKPVINIEDKGMGTWVVRGKNHNDSATMSSHALGVAIDINPSTGSFMINGKAYGNGYNQRVMSKALWEQLPECHKKYHVLYEGCPIVEAFKSYGFVWGGDWSGTKDNMHFSWIADGVNCRENGQNNYLNRR